MLWIIVLFLSSMIVYSIFNLPANLLGSKLREAGATYSDIDGTFWNAQLENLWIADRHWQNADISINKLPITTGKFNADFELHAPDSAVSGNLVLIDNDQYQINRLSGGSEISFSLNGQAFTANISFSSEQLTMNSQGQCIEGTVNLKSDILEPVLSEFNIQIPPLSGSGSCSDGTSTLMMASEQDGIVVRYRGDFNGDRQRSLFKITLPPLLENKPQVTERLRGFGFNRNNELWQVATTIGML